MRLSTAKRQEILNLGSARMSPESIAQMVGVKTSVVSTVLNGPVDLGRPPPAIPGLARFGHARIDVERSAELSPDHPALTEARTIFPSTVVPAASSPRLLVGGHNNPKLGRTVLKGDRAGWPIYHLTLEERATCPRSCAQWSACYGNAMHRARRHRVDGGFVVQLRGEVRKLARQHPDGFLIRLHTLGDFFSVEYVLAWGEILRDFPSAHAFGYTARRVDDEDPASARIAQAIELLRGAFWSRFAIRTSHLEIGPERAVVVDDPPLSPDVLLCPAQTEQSAACATCGLCWSESARPKTIAFLRHGMKRPAARERAPEPDVRPLEPEPPPAIQAERPSAPPAARPEPVTGLREVRRRQEARQPSRAIPRGARIENLGEGVQVIRMKPLTDRLLRHARAQIENGLSIPECADFFDVDAEALEAALKVRA